MLILKTNGVYIFISNNPHPYYEKRISFLKRHIRCDILQSFVKNHLTSFVTKRRNPMAILNKMLQGLLTFEFYIITVARILLLYDYYFQIKHIPHVSK